MSHQPEITGLHVWQAL